MTIDVQICTACDTVQYPRREVCRACLSAALEDREDSGAGTLLAIATAHRSLEEAFGPTLPAVIGKALLDCGIHVVCFVRDGSKVGARITLSRGVNIKGEPTWLAQG